MALSEKDFAPLNEEEIIEGFDIEIDKKSKTRIDRIVDSYEKAVMSSVEEEYIKSETRSNKVADKIATFGGSWRFIIIMVSALAFWLLWNSLYFIPKSWHFDPAPFILLNLVLSFTAAFQAPIIMMSQNRQAARDKHESVIDFAINYKSEQEIDDMQSHLHRVELQIIELKELILNLQDQK